MKIDPEAITKKSKRIINTQFYQWNNELLFLKNKKKKGKNKTV